MADCSKVQDKPSNVRHIQATAGAFAAILDSGAVVTWGDPECGGGSGRVQEHLRNVQHIQATQGALAAILEFGAVVTWGNAECGADSSKVEEQLRLNLRLQR